MSSQGYYETPHVVEPHKPTNLSASYSQKDTGDASYVWTIDGVVVPALPSPRLTHRFVTTGAHTVNVTRTDSERTLHAVVSVFSRCARTREQLGKTECERAFGTAKHCVVCEVGRHPPAEDLSDF